MDITAQYTAGNSIQAYGPEGFRINGVHYEGAVLVSAAVVMPFMPLQLSAVTLAALAPLLDAPPPVELLIIGTGAYMRPVPGPLRQALRARNIRVDAMATGAACRSYTIMHSENRRVGALLLPVTE